MKIDRLLYVFFVIVVISCSNDDALIRPDDGSNSSTPNILLIIADDLGKDALSGFSEGSIKPITPNINNLKSAGISFSNSWVYPTCSPTRASILTGKYGYRTGVKFANDVLSNSENILQNYISQQTNNSYATAVIGKWHLAGNGNNTFNPEDFGIDYYEGLLGGGVLNYNQWRITSDGESRIESSYITEKFTDLSIDWIQQQNKPWFLCLSYTAPHTPFHAPPSEMHSQGNLPEYSTQLDPFPYYLAAVEAMDYQIGRLLESMSSDERRNTLIIFIGDNGTPEQVVQLPYTPSKAKGSLYQGGINTPLIVAGANVNRLGVTDPSLISSTDLFATIADIAGASMTNIHDSKSFKHLLSNTGEHREFQYSESDNGSINYWVISNGTFKLFTYENGTQEMYNLINDPYESINLLNSALSAQEIRAKQVLENELNRIRI